MNHSAGITPTVSAAPAAGLNPQEEKKKAEKTRFFNSEEEFGKAMADEWPEHRQVWIDKHG